MLLTEIKKSLFGYNPQEVCRYISELNEIHTAAENAAQEKFLHISEELNEKNASLVSENEELKAETEVLNTEIASLKAAIEDLKRENSELNVACQSLNDELGGFREKSDIISTAILNAEKCADTLVEDAKSRANTMVSEAQDRVSQEVNRLEIAKKYISEIKESVSLTMKNIENALTSVETSIDDKKSDVVDAGKKITAREKFELLEKNIFKRA